MTLLDRLRMVRGEGLTLGTLLDHLAEIRGDKQAVEEHGSGLRLTYREAADRVADLAAGLASRVTPGESVVVAVPNGYEMFLLCLAVSRAGGVPVPVNPRMRQVEIDHVVADSGASTVIRDMGDVGGGEPQPPHVAEPGDVAVLFYTSGTTGKPKGAELTHRGLVSGGQRLALVPGFISGELVTGLPVAHVAGFSALVMTACLGVPVYLLPKFRPDTALDAIESRRAKAFLGVPAMYRMMMEAGAEERDLTSVRLWASGADAMPEELARRFADMGASVTLPLLGRSVGPATFLDGYGMVELSGGVAVRAVIGPLDPPLVPLPGYRIKIVDDDGEELGRGEVGEIVVRGPGVLRGYHANEQATSEILTPDGWLRTGDLGRKGPLGMIRFAGRKKHVIKHGGYSVFAVEVEQALEQHPDVLEASVLGLPDERKGEIPVAAVRLRPGATVDGDAVRAWAAENLSDYKAPQQIRMVDEMPRGSTDKVQKDRLLELFQSADEAGATA